MTPIIMCLRRFGNTRKDRLSLLMPDSGFFESPTDQLALRFARNAEDYPGIVWLSWGESSSRKSMAWTGCKIAGLE